MKQKIYEGNQQGEFEAEASDSVSKLDAFARNFENELSDAMRLTNGNRHEIVRKAFELVGEAGLDPVKIAAVDARLAFQAVVKGEPVYGQARLHAKNMQTFGDLRLALVAAGAA